jgi:tetratricopeptide (TPR) repeat protein
MVFSSVRDGRAPRLRRARLATAAGVLCALALAGGTLAADSADFNAEIEALAKAWAHVNYEIPDKRAEGREAARLAAQADALANRHPDRAEPLMLEAMLLLSEADTKRDMRGLNLAVKAKSLLDQAERIDPDPFGDGSLYALIGNLYAQVPGFPIAYGSKKKARLYLGKALAINPKSLDANFFMGDFLLAEDKPAEAIVALQRALNAPARPGRAVADRGRKREAAESLARARQDLADRKGR